LSNNQRRCHNVLTESLECRIGIASALNPLHFRQQGRCGPLDELFTNNLFIIGGPEARRTLSTSINRKELYQIYWGN
jgi:hypothetical protein